MVLSKVGWLWLAKTQLLKKSIGCHRKLEMSSLSQKMKGAFVFLDRGNTIFSEKNPLLRL